MKFFAYLTSMSLLLALAACAPDADKVTDIDAVVESLNNPIPEILLTGGDRDVHGCIGSAGYTWSELRAECVRIFEVGIPLENMQDLNSTSVAYLILNGSDQIELFGSDSDPVQLFKTETNIWQDTDKILTVKLETPTQYAVYKDGRRLFFQNQSGSNPVNADEYEEVSRPDVDDILTETGVLTNLEEDGAYPFYTITMEVPKRDMRAGFTLNVEAVIIDINALYAHMNETISVDYTRDRVLNVVEIELESGFLNGTENREDLRDYKTASGIMQDASVTMGDLPGTFYVKDAEDHRTYFEEYVTADMVAGNDRQVTVYYSERYQNMVTGIDLSDK